MALHLQIEPNLSLNSQLLLIIVIELSSSEYIMRNSELEETQAGIKIAGRNINNLRYADDTTLYGRK